MKKNYTQNFFSIFKKATEEVFNKIRDQAKVKIDVKLKCLLILKKFVPKNNLSLF
jgi:hypothetical protein